MAERRFPDGFLWGCATAAHQVEGGNHGSDWWEFERRGGIRTGDSSDPACDHYHRFREDFRQLSELGNNAHRLSIEWSRIEPIEGEFDLREVAHYREVLAALKGLGMAPMVTLHHFTSPAWFARRGGWSASGAAEAWLPFVRRVATELGDLVSQWCTLNEPNIYAYQGWVAGEFPPGRRGDLAGMLRVLGNFQRAHEAAYRELHRLTPDVPVGIAQHRWLMLPAGRGPLDRLAAATLETVMRSWPAAGRLRRVVDAPSDYVGLNHYSASLVRFDPHRPGQAFARRFNPSWLPESDFGWSINAEWLGRALLDLGGLGKPVYVTENGVASADDAVRRRYVLDAVGQVWQAIELGVDVRGYFHWTSIDNFEWAHGYSMRFGLIAVDPKTQERTLKPSAELFARIAGANALPAEDPG